MKSKITQGELTRPSNTTAYAAGAVIASSDAERHLVLTNVFNVKADRAYASPDFFGYITKIVEYTNVTTGTARMRLHFFKENTTQLKTLTDGTPYAKFYSEAANYFGSIDLPAPITGGVGSTAVLRQVKDLLHGFQASGSNTLTVVRVTLDAFTPASSQKFFTQLSIQG